MTLFPAISGQNQFFRLRAVQTDSGDPNHLGMNKSKLELSFASLNLKSTVDLGLRWANSSVDPLVEAIIMWSLRRFEKSN